jgi:hypothetical protein
MRSTLMMMLSSLALVVWPVCAIGATADGALTSDGAKQDVRVLKRVLSR